MNNAKGWMIGALVGLLVLVAVGGGGFYFGHQRAQPGLEAAEEDAAGARRELATLTEERDAERAQHAAVIREREAHLARLEARRQIAIALDELDARNFGLAQQRCADAATQLGTIEAPDEDTRALTEALAAHRFELGGDFETSRQQLRAFARELDARLAEDGTEA